MTPQLLDLEMTDWEQKAFIAVFADFVTVHGAPDTWAGPQEAAYLAALRRVHHIFHPDYTASVAAGFVEDVDAWAARALPAPSPGVDVAAASHPLTPRGYRPAHTPSTPEEGDHA